MFKIYRLFLFLLFALILSLSIVSVYSMNGEQYSVELRSSSRDSDLVSINLEIKNGLDTTECKEVAANKLNNFRNYLGSLEKFLIHDNTDLRRGLANHRLIYVRCLNDIAEFTNVLVHEIGHVIDLGYLVGTDDSLDSNFNDFGNPVKLDDPSYDFYSISWIDNENWQFSTTADSFVSGYASTDPFEDFAESFMMYVLYPELFLSMSQGNSQLLRKYNFMKYTVFNGFEFITEDAVALTSYGLNLDKIRLYDATQIHKFLAFDL